jgi:transcription elongation factor GreB
VVHHFRRKNDYFATTPYSYVINDPLRDPRTQPADRVRFGATVTVRGEDGAERRYRIVGVDEAEPARGALSWRSPLAAALLGARVGDTVTFRLPRGEEELKVVMLSYAESETGA